MCGTLAQWIAMLHETFLTIFQTKIHKAGIETLLESKSVAITKALAHRESRHTNSNRANWRDQQTSICLKS
jgi:hypothetical protein